MEEIKELFYSFVRIMSAAVDERTPYNASHTRQMAEYTRSFVRYLRERFPEGSPYHMDENREEQLIMATLLHDIGKIVTPLGVMNKQSRLGGRLPLLKQRFTVKKLQAKIAFLSGEVSEDAYASEAAALDGDWEFIERINTAELISDGDRERVKSVTARTYTGENGVPAPLFEPYDIECLSVAKGTLTDAEREIMREHVEITGRFLDNIKFNKQYENVPGWAKSHHELLDGTGYPDRLPGSRIPTEVRILTVMDVYDSLTASDRPYKKALTHETALRILRSMAEEGKLDAEIVSLFSESGIRVL
ncbi:MAG: HD domain-containing protein [Oscillospiraceae bacterium]|nr:HD domain-containing protein [Oscillospiraceae bacterium]